MIYFDKKAQSERLKALRTHLNLKQEQLSILLNVSQGYYSELERGVKQLSHNIVESIANCFNDKTQSMLSLDWLMFGVGEMFLKDASKKIINGENATVNIHSNNGDGAVINQGNDIELNGNCTEQIRNKDMKIAFLKEKIDMLYQTLEDKQQIINLLQNK